MKFFRFVSLILINNFLKMMMNLNSFQTKLSFQATLSRELLSVLQLGI